MPRSKSFSYTTKEKNDILEAFGISPSITSSVGVELPAIIPTDAIDIVKAYGGTPKAATRKEPILAQTIPILKFPPAATDDAPINELLTPPGEVVYKLVSQLLGDSDTPTSEGA